MRMRRNLSISLLLFISLPLASSRAAQVSPKFANLNGNWKLAGDREQKIYPKLSVNLAVDGDRIIGAANYDIICSDKIRRHFASDVRLDGKIDRDGSFTISSATYQVEVVIKGVVPADRAKAWNGTYAFIIPPYKSLSANPYGECTSPQSGSFVASAYASIGGTYSGRVTGPGFGSDVSVTIKIAEAGTPQSPNFPPFPLSATISVQGSPCFVHGTSRTPIDGNQLFGDRFDLNFDMDGAAVLMVDGWIAGAGSETLRDVRFQVGLEGSRCFPASASGTLSRL
jgi:hypothetical protein